MSAGTKIEWCDATINWWAGCTQISPACDNCYAKAMAKRLWGVQWGAESPRRQFKGATATLEALDRSGQNQWPPLKVFHNSLSDFFDNEVPAAWRTEALHTIAYTPFLIHLLLTKRIGNAHAMLDESMESLGFDRWSSELWRDVWLGATICDQEEADRDIPKLLAVPAAKRFLSMEPLLGPVELGLCNCDKGSRPGPGGAGGVTCPHCNGSGGRMLDWVIVGGESGANARPMHPDWVRSLRDQCQSAGVPFFFKQWGEWLPYDYLDAETKASTQSKDWQRAHGSDFDRGMVRVGKKAAGRMLDGREWNEVP